LPEYISGLPTDEAIEQVRQLFEKHGLGYLLGEAPSHWVKNLRKIGRFWNNDPVNLLRGDVGFEEACRRIMYKTSQKSEDDPNGFLGFAEKMVGMIAYFWMDADLIEQRLFPVPVDFHVLRLMIANELLVPEEHDGNHYRDIFLAAARELTMWYCREHNVESRELSDALWMMSRNACRYNPHNRTHKGEYKARKTPLQPIPVVWNDAQIRAYDRSCGRCPISEFCKHNVPSAEYYTQGKLVIRGLRTGPPPWAGLPLFVLPTA
jgi:hypothetical protein